MRCVCDFCSHPSVGWRYPARSFVAYITDEVAGQSVGDWAACDTCHEFIENDDRAGLAAHSINSLIRVQPEFEIAREELSREMERLHGTFFSNRMGAPINEVAQCRA
jgi:hypothetical protein